MTTDTATPAADLIDQAARHLTAAADLAEELDTPAADALAAQIVLVRAALTPTPPLDDEPTSAKPTTAERAVEATVAGRLEAALTALDLIEPLDGPADLPVCAWHVGELARLVRAGRAS